MIRWRLSPGATAEAQLSDFEKQFSVLEITMDNIGDKIEGFAKKEFDSAADFAALAKRLSETGLMLGVFISAWAVYVMRHDVLSPLSLMIGAMKKLAHGNVESAVPQLSALQNERHDELGEMARSVEVFRTNALARNQLTRESRILSDLNEWLQSAKSENELYQMIADVRFAHAAGVYRKSLYLRQLARHPGVRENVERYARYADDASRRLLGLAARPDLHAWAERNRVIVRMCSRKRGQTIAAYLFSRTVNPSACCI